MQNKLLPCPFCGGEAEKRAFTWANIADEVTIDCTICGVRTKVLKTEEAIKIWNTRKPMERILEQLEERRAVFDCRVCRHFDKGDGSECDEDCTDALIDDLIDIVKGGVDNG